MPTPRPHCRHCDRLIVGCAETKYGYGWVHAATNREACYHTHPSRPVAEPVTVDDMREAGNERMRRSRERRR